MPDHSRLYREPESETLDRKRSWPTSVVKLVHDLLCLCNSFADEDRYLVFGVGNDGTIHGVEEDENRRTNAQVQDLLRQQPLNRLPTVHIRTLENSGHEVDVLRIRNRPDKPFFLTSDKIFRGDTIRAGVVYTRIGDTNVPLGESAPEEMVELMWRERFGIGKPPLLRLHNLLDEPEDWTQAEELEPLYHRQYPEFTVLVGETVVDNFKDEWSQRFPDPQARSYQVSGCYLGVVLERYVFVSCDGGRYQMPVPSRDKEGFYLERDSVFPVSRSRTV